MRLDLIDEYRLDLTLNGDRVTSEVFAGKPSPVANEARGYRVPPDPYKADIAASAFAVMAVLTAIAMSGCNGGEQADASNTTGSDDQPQYVNFPVRNDDMAPKFPLIERSLLAFDPAAYDARRPKVGDIVLFRAPRGARKRACASPPRPGRACSRARPLGRRRMVLRVVARPGQRIAFRKGRAIVDGVPERKRKLLIEKDCADCTLPVEVRVPRRHLFLAGDHRSEAIDSRSFGPVPVRAVIGEYAGYVTD